MSTAERAVRVISCDPHSVMTWQVTVTTTVPPGTGAGTGGSGSQLRPSVACRFASRAAVLAAAPPLWLIDAARAASRAAPWVTARPSVTRPTEMMNEMTSSRVGASTASSSENEPRSPRR